MTYIYVSIPRINGRKDRIDLAEFVERNSLRLVEYNEGGWADASLFPIAPHLRFENAEDALVYILARGGKFHLQPPDLTAGKNYNGVLPSAMP